MRSILTVASLSLALSACSPDSLLDQARKLGHREFTPQSWAAASQIERGRMTASFLRQYDVKAVSSIYRTGYLLAFDANKTDGQIEQVRFVPEVQ